MRIAILIPAYNVAKAISQVILETARYAPRQDIVVVDDGSVDDTISAIRSGDVTVIRHRKNRGKGAALRTGFRHVMASGYDGVIVLDADGQHDPQFIPLFIGRALRGDADVIVGSRMDQVGEMPLLRQLTNRITSAVVSALARQRIPDSQSGYRLIRSHVLRKLRLRTHRYDTESEMLIQAGRLGYTIGSLPISSIYRDEKSAIKPGRDTLQFVLLILRTALSL